MECVRERSTHFNVFSQNRCILVIVFEEHCTRSNLPGYWTLLKTRAKIVSWVSSVKVVWEKTMQDINTLCNRFTYKHDRSIKIWRRVLGQKLQWNDCLLDYWKTMTGYSWAAGLRAKLSTSAVAFSCLSAATAPQRNVMKGVWEKHTRAPDNDSWQLLHRLHSYTRGGYRLDTCETKEDVANIVHKSTREWILHVRPGNQL